MTVSIEPSDEEQQAKRDKYFTMAMIFCLLLILTTTAVWRGKTRRLEKEQWFTECLTEKKRYECEFMWDSMRR